MTKATLPGIKQIYRVTGSDGYYKKDIIAFEGETLESYIEDGDTIESLLVPIIKDGKQTYDFPSISQISKKREEQLSRFKNINSYDVIISSEVKSRQEEIFRQYGINVLKPATNAIELTTEKRYAFDYDGFNEGIA
jgi:hypothetical protein